MYSLGIVDSNSEILRNRKTKNEISDMNSMVNMYISIMMINYSSTI